MSDQLVSVRNVVAKAQEFDSLNSREQAALRASITRLLPQVDDKLKGVLLKVRGVIGESAAKKSYDKLTVEDVETEFDERFADMTDKERPPFKAKVTRMLNAADEAGETEVKKRLAALQYRIYEFENRAVKDEIDGLLEALLSTDDEDDDLDTVAEIG